MPAPLLTPELLRRLEQFQLLAARRAKSSARGERRSKARGQSVEFADHRSYIQRVSIAKMVPHLHARSDWTIVPHASARRHRERRMGRVVSPDAARTLARQR